jgi:Na+/H+ antiporter NhaD/arsenite permease-like protein
MTGVRELAYVAAGVLLLWAGVTGWPRAHRVLHVVWRVVACLLGVIVVSGGIAAVLT